MLQVHFKLFSMGHNLSVLITSLLSSLWNQMKMTFKDFQNSNSAYHCVTVEICVFGFQCYNRVPFATFDLNFQFDVSNLQYNM